MKFRFLNKTIENRQFDYSPMYYSERKERLTQKREHYRKIQENELSEDEKRSFYKSSMKENWSRTQMRQNHTKSANMRTVILIAIIVALGYFIFNGVDEVDTVVTKVW
jgi:Na+/glutamate symporter